MPLTTPRSPSSTVYLVGAARFEVERRRAGLPHLRGGDHEDIVHESADDALLALLGKLDDFRGESRFTTWAFMSMRGAQKFGAATVTSALHGQVRDDPRTRAEFLALATSGKR